MFPQNSHNVRRSTQYCTGLCNSQSSAPVWCETFKERTILHFWLLVLDLVCLLNIPCVYMFTITCTFKSFKM